MKFLFNGAIGRTLIIASILSVVGLFTASPLFAEGVSLSKGQTIYVPAYSYVRIGERGHQFELAVNLCIRNTDPAQAITVLSVDYYDTDGKLLKRYLENPAELKPLAAINFFVRSSDISGGLAPSFIVKWKSANQVSTPMTEAAMIGDKSGQGISFTANGKVIKDTPD